MTEPFDETRPASDAQVHLVRALLSTCARWLMADPDPQRFMARMAVGGPVLFPALVHSDGMIQREPRARGSAAPPDAELAQFFRAFAWMVAGLMPLPARGFKAMKLPRPGRNDPCVCGSLRKFKQCCAPFFLHMPSLEPEVLATVVIDVMPRKQWATLPASGATPDMVFAAAISMRQDERDDDALRLLEPWGKLPHPWPDALANLLDLLGDLYLDLDKPRKRKQLAQAMLEPRNGVHVQSVGWQRLSMMAADAGDPVASQAAFERAQRLTPDEPRVALLEVTTLLAGGQTERAQARADFHVKRLPALADDIRVLEILARGDFADLGLEPGWDSDDADGERGDAPVLDPNGALISLIKWAQGLPAPRLSLDLSGASPEDLGALRACKADRALLQRWAAAFRLPAPERAHERWAEAAVLRVFEGDLWSPLLMREPRLIDHFEVLDQVVMALEVVPHGRADELIALLSLRAQFLWDQLREQYPAARCEWAHRENRPALRLLVRRVMSDETPTARHGYEALRALVDVLNPHDNHGLRERLAAVYLRRGEVDAALALCARYPKDFVGMQLLHVRALLMAGRAGEAAAQLAQAHLANRHALDVLRARRAPRIPEADHYTVGSLDEAKIAVAPQFDLWRGDPAVTAWLARQSSGAQSDPAMPSLFGPDE
jgi:SEC-C motif